MALTNPLLDELGGLSPEAKQALVQAHTQASVTAATPAGIQAPTASATPPMIGKNELGDTMGRTNELGGALPSTATMSAPAETPAPAPTQLEHDQAKRAQMMAEGPGITQIHSKIENAMPNHPTLGKILGYGAEIPARVAEAAGSMFAPVRTAEMMLPGTTAHHALQLSNLNKVIGQESEENLKGAQQANYEAEIPQHEALAEEERARAANLPAELERQNKLTDAQVENLLHPQAKTEFEAWRQQHPTALVEEFLRAQNEAKNVKPDTPEQQYIDDYQKRNPGASIADAVRAYAKDTTKAPVTNLTTLHEHEGQDYIVPDGQGGKKLVRIYPGESVPTGAQTQAGVNTVNTPTGSIRTGASRADIVLQGIPDVLNDLHANAAQLGPGMGRFNDIYSGKIGAPNPEFSGLVADLRLLSTAVTVAHAQGRMSNELLNEFNSMIAQPKQSPQNIESVLTKVQKFMERQSAMGGGQGANGGQSGGGEAVVYDDKGVGHRYKGVGSRTDPANYEVVNGTK